MTVSEALRGVARLGLDTSPFINFVERKAPYFDRCARVFEEIDKGTVQATTGAITVTEVLVLPLRANATRLVAGYREIMTAFGPSLTVVSIDSAVADYAADLRARYSLRTPDALQVAAALHAGCDAFLTGDKGLRCVTEIKVLVLDDLTP